MRFCNMSPILTYVFIVARHKENGEGYSFIVRTVVFNVPWAHGDNAKSTRILEMSSLI